MRVGNHKIEDRILLKKAARDGCRKSLAIIYRKHGIKMHMLYSKKAFDTVLLSEKLELTPPSTGTIHYEVPSRVLNSLQPFFFITSLSGASCNSGIHLNMVDCQLDKYPLNKNLCCAVTIFKNLKKNNISPSLALVCGDKYKLADIYLKYQERIKMYILSLGVTPVDAEDIKQDVFAQICHDYANGGSIVHIERYLFGVTRNIVREYHRHNNNHHVEFILKLTDDLIQYQDLQEQLMVKKQARVHKVIGILPFKYRQAIELRFLQGLSPRLASKYAKCSPNTFYQRVHIATRMLKDKVKFPSD